MNRIRRLAAGCSALAAATSPIRLGPATSRISPAFGNLESMRYPAGRRLPAGEGTITGPGDSGSAGRRITQIPVAGGRRASEQRAVGRAA
jgi:hypothetical protein